MGPHAGGAKAPSNPTRNSIELEYFSTLSNQTLLNPRVIVRHHIAMTHSMQISSLGFSVCLSLLLATTACELQPRPKHDAGASGGEGGSAGAAGSAGHGGTGGVGVSGTSTGGPAGQGGQGGAGGQGGDGAPLCGDGVIASDEGCDDGNTQAGDGCGANCSIESGYACNGEPSTCADIDECALDLDDCHANATCSNTPGSFTCTCVPGYSGDGVVACIDDDECTNGGNDCALNATCTNLPGSFTCTCDLGYVGDGVSCACPAGMLDCDGIESNACEVNPLSNANHCGACGTSANDGNPCTMDGCVGGMPAHTNVALHVACGSSLACNGAGACLTANGSPCVADTDCAIGFCVSNLCGGPPCSTGSQCSSHICDNEVCLPAQPPNGPLDWVTVVLAKEPNVQNYFPISLDVSTMVARDDGGVTLLGKASGWQLLYFGPVLVAAAWTVSPTFDAHFDSGGAVTGGQMYESFYLTGYLEMAPFPAGGGGGYARYDADNHLSCGTQLWAPGWFHGFGVGLPEAFGGAGGHVTIGTSIPCKWDPLKNVDYGDGMPVSDPRLVTYTPLGAVLMNMPRSAFPSGAIMVGPVGELYFPSGNTLTKYSPQGVLQWTQSFSQISAPIWDVDMAGNVLLAFNFSGMVDIGLGPMTSVGTSDLALVKIDANGNAVWQRQFGGVGFDQNIIAMKRTGISEFAVQTAISGAIDLGDGPWVGPMVLAKFDAMGNFSWHVDYAGTAEFLSGNASGEVFMGSDGQTFDLGWGPPLVGKQGFILAKYGP